MTRINLNEELLEYLVIGGSFYGGGGGGSTTSGREMGRMALRLGGPHLVEVGDLPDDALLLTVSAVGAPAGGGPHATPADYVKTVELFQRHTGKTVSGFIANECGGLATVNGWVQSAATGLPVVDAPCNGRAHPTGAMGSMGLNRVEGYVSEQVAVGGSRADGSYLEVFIRGSVESASGLVRKTAGQAGGLVAVARNPVTVSYARDHAAPGAIRRCLEIGRAIVEGRSRSARDAVEGAALSAGGRVACAGKVVHAHIESAGGFDLGKVIVQGSDALVELVFCNEYLTMESIGPANGDNPNGAANPKSGANRRLATFPDLITTLDLSTGLPVTSAEIHAGQEVAVVVVPRGSLILGAGMRDKGLYADVDRVTGTDLARYVFSE